MSDWQAKAREHKSKCDAKIPAEWRLPSHVVELLTEKSTRCVLREPAELGLLTPREIEITESVDARYLTLQLAHKRYTVVEVITAFSKRAAISHQLTNCLTETFFDSALERAKFLDDYYEGNGKPYGPLHGLPVSLKDSYNVKGIPTNIGYVSFLERPLPEKNAHMVDILLELGAVIYVKTNVPQTMMTADSHNNIYGRTLNPYNLSLTAGGSSGGEGALLALRGSILGIGTDVAGSLRIPAVCNNVYAFKPSSGRLPYGRQVLAVRAGTPGIIPSAGFFSHSSRDLWFLSRNVILKEPWDRDAAAHAIHWRDVKPKGQLVIGVISEDTAVPVAQPILDAIKEICGKLRKEGTHIVKEIKDFPSLADSTALAWEYFSTDESGYPMAAVKASGEPFIPSISTVALPSRGLGRSLDRLFDMNVERAEFKDRWRRLFVEKEGIDVLLMPAAQHAAVPHDTWKRADYTVVWNLVDYPAAVMPYIPDGHDKNGAVDTLVPSIQLVGRPLQDEELLRAVQMISDVLEKGYTTQWMTHDDVNVM